jgi:hypothetical protein
MSTWTTLKFGQLLDCVGLTVSSYYKILSLTAFLDTSPFANLQKCGNVQLLCKYLELVTSGSHPFIVS